MLFGGNEKNYVKITIPLIILNYIFIEENIHKYIF